MPYKELKIVTKKTLEDAADAIRTKLGTSDKIAPEDFDDSIGDIPTGITPTGTKSITANGTGIDVTEYAAVDVAVPGPTGTLQISQNGTYNVTRYASAEVNVSGGGGGDDPAHTLVAFDSNELGTTDQDPVSGSEVVIDITSQVLTEPQILNKVFGYVMRNGNPWTIFGEYQGYEGERKMRVRVMVSQGQM